MVSDDDVASDVPLPGDGLLIPDDMMEGLPSDSQCIDPLPSEQADSPAQHAQGRQRSVAQVRPINISETVRELAGSNPMRAVQNSLSETSL